MNMYRGVIEEEKKWKKHTCLDHTSVCHEKTRERWLKVQWFDDAMPARPTLILLAPLAAASTWC